MQLNDKELMIMCNKFLPRRLCPTMWTGPLPLTKVNVTGGSGKLRSRIICAVFPISSKAIGVLIGPFSPIASTCSTLSSPDLASGPKSAYTKLTSRNWKLILLATSVPLYLRIALHKILIRLINFLFCLNLLTNFTFNYIFNTEKWNFRIKCLFILQKSEFLHLK